MHTTTEESTVLKTGTPKVLVAVSSGDDIDAALTYAATQARLRGCGVHVVTALHPVILGPSEANELTIIEGELRSAGRVVLARAAEALEAQLGETDLPVSTEVLHGPVVPSLVEAAEHAALLVIQRQHPAPLPRIAVMSMANAVAARSAVPVVTVPVDWHPGPDAPVVIGVEDVDDSAVSGEVVRTGLELARLQGTSAWLVHGWFFSDAYDDLVFNGGAAARESADRRARLDAAMADLVAGFPDVRVTSVVQHRRPADLLVALAETGSAVVVGRHHHTLPGWSHLGPITRAVLRESPRPVVVVDPRPPTL